MKTTVQLSLSLSLLVYASTAFASFSLSNVKRITSVGGGVVPNKFIVEVQDVSDILSGRSLESRSPHEMLYESLRKQGVSFDIDREFKSEGIFTGVAISLTNPQDVAQISQLSGVIAVRPVVVIQPPKPVSIHVVSGVDDPAIPPDTESTHILTGVDKLHAQGITGKGIKIGIIDTGIDYTHPLLGGGIGPGHKVIGGFDFVGDAFDGTNTPMPDPDPLDQCNGHGTHVAGIIGANPGNEFNISGVAYEASLSSYRVFGCTGTVPDDILVEALLRGVSDGQNILTMSLGGADGWTEGTASVVSSRIAATGKIVTIAAGNDGSIGSWYTSGPGNAINAISVASLDNTVIPLQNATVHGVVHDPITYFDTFPLAVNGTLPIFATSTDATVLDDACDPLPDSTPDLSSFVVIIRRGTCTFVQKLTNVAAKGGNISLIYDNGSGFSAIDVGNFTATLIQASDGEFLVNTFATGQNISLSFPQTGGSFNFPDSAGGLISSFTSFGPSNDFFFKPAIAAPGGNILSTLPVPLGSFGVESGTSMATPFIAGVSALLFGVKGTSPEVGTTARTLFETTAQRVPSSHTDGDPLQTVTQQGAGLVDAFKAIHADVIVSPGELITNDTAHFKGTDTFTVKNIGNTVKTFTLSHIPAGTALTFQSGTIFPADGPVPLSTTSATVKFSETSFTVHPGQTQQITVHITPPQGLDPALFPVFSGFINIAGPTVAESYQVTYLGLAAALQDAQVVDNTDVFFGAPIPAIVDANGNFQNTTTNYTFTGTDTPTLLVRLAFGTPVLRVDLVNPDIAIKATLNRRSEARHVFNRDVFTFPRPMSKGNSFSQVQIVGPLFEFDFQPRNSDVDDGTGFNTFGFTNATFANGTAIPNGAYRFLLRALKVTGDVTKEEDFESWLSPIVGIDVPT